MVIAPDGYFYHYCGLEALNGIIETKSLWMTNLFYMNDRLEHFWLRHITIDVLNGKMEEAHRQAQTDDAAVRLNSLLVRDLYSMLLANIRTDGMEDIFCTSFSVLPDSLSQWRAYADDGFGFAVGFDGDQLTKLHSYLKEVNYDDKHHTSLVETYCADAIRQMKAVMATNVGKLDDVIDQFRRKVWDEAIYCKNPAFKEEEEWRLVHKANIERHPDTGDVQTSSARQIYKFRPRGKQLIPYVDFRFGMTPMGPPGPIRHIVFGPKNTSKEQERVLRDRLSQEDFMCVKFSRSGASYR